jgi:hypothetical protein
MTQGAFITATRAALLGSPLASLIGNVNALDRFNEYASRFHHGNPNAPNEPLLEHDLRHYARGALSLIHDDGVAHPL